MQTKAAVRVNAPQTVSTLWVPKEDSMLLIELPGERLLARVAKLVNQDVVICELVATPLMQKTHRYEKADFVPCERTFNGMETIWRSFKPAPRIEPTPPAKTRKRKART